MTNREIQLNKILYQIFLYKSGIYESDLFKKDYFFTESLYPLMDDNLIEASIDINFDFNNLKEDDYTITYVVNIEFDDINITSLENLRKNAQILTYVIECIDEMISRVTCEEDIYYVKNSTERYIYGNNIKIHFNQIIDNSIIENLYKKWLSENKLYEDELNKTLFKYISYLPNSVEVYSYIDNDEIYISFDNSEPVSDEDLYDTVTFDTVTFNTLCKLNIETLDTKLYTKELREFIKDIKTLK